MIQIDVFVCLLNDKYSISKFCWLFSTTTSLGWRRKEAEKKRLNIIHYSSDKSLKRMSYQINWVRKSFPSLGLESTAFLAHHFMFGSKNMRSKASECSHSREEREARNKVQMCKGRAAAWPSSRGKQKITLYKNPGTILLCQRCFCSRNQRNLRASSYFFSKYWPSLPFCTLLYRGSLKVSPLFWWSSTVPRILLLVSCCTNTTHIAGLSAYT